MKIGLLFPIAIIIAGVSFLAWFIASGEPCPVPELLGTIP